jgi:hypothetical protein
MLVVMAVLAGCLALAAGPATAAKKKGKKGGGTVNITKAVNLPIPDRAGPGFEGRFGVLTSTIDVGKRFKGRQVRDVNVTLQTLGLTGERPAAQLEAKLTAPNGATMALFTDLFAGFAPIPNLSVGPLTFDDEALLDIGRGPARDPTELYAPWAGAAAPEGILAQLDGGPVRGAWTLTMLDDEGSGPESGTSNLVSWTLNVVAGRPFQAK